MRVLLVQFLLLSVCIGRSELIGPSVVAKLGGEAILPCHLQSPTDATFFTLEWTRPDLQPRFVYVWRDGQELLGKKHQLFEGRTSLLTDELKHGNVSLKISGVGISDEGTYRCFIPSQDKQSFIQLIVASDDVCSPVISVAGTDEEKSRVVLQCESAGWYPQPELFWLDDEGTLLSAAPTETVPTPDGLFTVSSRVTVEKRHNSSFLCRVHQKNTNQTRETHIHVPEDLFVSPSRHLPLVAALAFTSTLCILLISAGSFLAWKRRQNLMLSREVNEKEDGGDKSESNNEEVRLMVENKPSEELLETKEKLKESEKVVEDLRLKLHSSSAKITNLQKQLEEQQAAQSSWIPTFFWRSTNQQTTNESDKEQSDQEAFEKQWKKMTEELEATREELENTTSALYQTKRHVDKLLAENQTLKGEKQRLENVIKEK